jgi:hypothetical protein
VGLFCGGFGGKFIIGLAKGGGGYGNGKGNIKGLNGDCGGICCFSIIIIISSA